MQGKSLAVLFDIYRNNVLKSEYERNDKASYAGKDAGNGAKAE